MGALLTVAGLATSVYAASAWGSIHFGALDYSHTMRLVIPAALFLIWRTNRLRQFLRERAGVAAAMSPLSPEAGPRVRPSAAGIRGGKSCIASAIPVSWQTVRSAP